ncbi:hypothetical protein Trydic_g21539 [Trypoxylus dichotomus]
MTLWQRALSSRTELSQFLQNDKMFRKYSFENNFLSKLNNKEKWNGESSSYLLNASTSTWYTDSSKTDKGTDARIFEPGTKYSETIENTRTYPSVFQAEINAI